jgi:mitogen-activated protein kinase kinase kinase
LERLDHPNIVSYFGIEVHRDRCFIFMEYCSNGSLKSLLENGPIEDEAVIQLYGYQLLRGLEYLHKQSIIHRGMNYYNNYSYLVQTLSQTTFYLTTKAF